MHKAFISIWLSYYVEKTGQNYILDGKQGMHLKQLIKKIESKVKERGMEVTEENMTNSFKGFLMLIKDKFTLENLDISMVNSRFNILYGKAVRENPFTAKERITEILRRGNS